MKFKEIPLKEIVVRENIRFEMEEDGELAGLMESIEQYGILQPILVRKKGFMYEVISGHRRFKAMQLRMEPTIPCMISENSVSDREKTFLQIVENNQRKQMSAAEYVEIFNKLKKQDPSMSNAKIGRLIGRSVGWIGNQYHACKLAGILISGGESARKLKKKTAGQIIGAAMEKGIGVKGARPTADISVVFINSRTLNVRCADRSILGMVLEAIDAVREKVRAEINEKEDEETGE